MENEFVYFFENTLPPDASDDEIYAFAQSLRDADDTFMIWLNEEDEDEEDGDFDGGEDDEVDGDFDNGDGDEDDDSDGVDGDEDADDFGV